MENKKYARLLSYCQRKDDTRHNNLIYVHDASKTVIATDGFRMLADRQLYAETKVLARVIGSENCLEYKEGIFIANTGQTIPGFTAIIPDQNKLNSDEYKRIGLTMPNWIKGISKREKKPYVSFVLGDDPMLTLGYYGGGYAFNAHFLKDFAGLQLKIYLKANDRKAPMIVTHDGGDIHSGDWFAMVMPLNEPDRVGAKYF
jgi:hypothetical protein